MKYLLEGGEFNNKGAEAMTLVALSHIYRNDKAAQVYMLYSSCNSPFELKEKIMYIPNQIWWLRERMGRTPIRYYKSRCIDFIKYFWPGKVSFWGQKKTSEQLLKSIDVVVDISGFAFSSKWGDDGVIEWLDQIKLMQNYGAKIYLMPQSFGPFDFVDPNVLEYGKEVLSKCEHIYAREKTGYELLVGLGLTNIECMPDSVLLEKDFNPSLIVKNIEKFREEIEISEKHNISIVPNYRLIDYGGMDINKLLDYYTYIVDRCKQLFNIYLVAHAGEDLIVCRAIKERYKYDDRIILVDHVMFSFNYEAFVKNMDFIVASRYHAIIHAYKENVPALIMGWADKYQGIAEIVNQTKYIIRLDELETSLNTVNEMIENYALEKENIKRELVEIQKKGCYSFLKDLHEN